MGGVKQFTVSSEERWYGLVFGSRLLLFLQSDSSHACPPSTGNPGSVMSPAGATSLEDQQYMEKLKQLSKYIEPLRRMINKIDKNEGRDRS